jgi:hypothetical protein
MDPTEVEAIRILPRLSGKTDPVQQDWQDHDAEQPKEETG